MCPIQRQEPLTPEEEEFQLQQYIEYLDNLAVQEQVKPTTHINSEK